MLDAEWLHEVVTAAKAPEAEVVQRYADMIPKMIKALTPRRNPLRARAGGGIRSHAQAFRVKSFVTDPLPGAAIRRTFRPTLGVLPA